MNVAQGIIILYISESNHAINQQLILQYAKSNL